MQAFVEDGALVAFYVLVFGIFVYVGVSLLLNIREDDKRHAELDEMYEQVDDAIERLRTASPEEKALVKKRLIDAGYVFEED